MNGVEGPGLEWRCVREENGDVNKQIAREAREWPGLRRYSQDIDVLIDIDEIRMSEMPELTSTNCGRLSL